MFCVVPPRDMKNGESAVSLQLNKTSEVSEQGTMSAVVVYRNQRTANFHFRTEDIPLSGFQEWVAAEKASPFPSDNPFFASYDDNKLKDKRMLRGPKFTNGSS